MLGKRTFPPLLDQIKKGTKGVRNISTAHNIPKQRDIQEDEDPIDEI
jgi:hypothetical protein